MVCRTGAEESDSSDAEEDTQSVQQDERLVNTVLNAHDGNLQTDDQGNIIQPSLAFCQALDNEQEYDEADAVAGTSLRGVSDPADRMPNRLTEARSDLHAADPLFGIITVHDTKFCQTSWHAAAVHYTEGKLWP